jgi:hypothetical protein
MPPIEGADAARESRTSSQIKSRVLIRDADGRDRQTPIPESGGRCQSGRNHTDVCPAPGDDH